MKRSLLVGLFGLSLLLPTVRAAEPTNWYADYDRARLEAKRTGRPMFLVFRCVP